MIRCSVCKLHQYTYDLDKWRIVGESMEKLWGEQTCDDCTKKIEAYIQKLKGGAE